MLLGIVGDTHNNLRNIEKICEISNSKKVDLVIHTGDITLPKSLFKFKNLNMKLIGVFGNNDQGEKEDLLETAKKFNCELHDDPYFFSFDNQDITIIHDPSDINDSIIKRSTIIFHGHTHRYRLDIIGKTLIFNPGECAGFMLGKNKIGLFDTKKEKINTVSF